MPENNYLYPFDPTGTASSNLITGEQHIISPPVNNDFYFVVPKNGPFFERNLKVTHYPSGAELINGVDFHLGWKFISASRATAKPVFGAICILNRELTGVIVIDKYQTLGGDWQINEQRAAELLLSNSVNPRTTSWEQVEELPYGFPVIDHEWDLDDMVGATELVESIDRVTEQLLANVAGAPQQHIDNFNNPHNVTKSQVGLGNVDNFSTAVLSDIADDGADNKFITPFLVRVMINSLTGGSVDEHLLDRNNPHQVTKLQVGLGSVENYAVATNAEMQSALPNNKYMTPANLAYYFASGAGVPLQTHISRTDNPHGVTKIQVGLGNVQNYQPASLANYAGVGSSEHYVTPNSVVAFFNQQQGDVEDHILDEENPHNVTKEQVGLSNVQNYQTAAVEDYIDGGLADRYVTPRSVVEYVSGVVSSFGNHVGAEDNPHNVTKSQVGLSVVENFAISTKLEAETGAVNNKYMTPIRVAEAIATQAILPLNNHVSSEDNPHNVTKLQVGLGNVENFTLSTKEEAELGDSNVKYMTPLRVAEAISFQVGLTTANHIANVNNPHNVTKSQVGLGNVEDYSVAQEVDFNSTGSQNKYVTPAAVIAYVSPKFNDVTTHIGNTNNPHNVTKTQVGLSDVENYGVAQPSDFDEGGVSNRYLTPSLVVSYVNQQITPLSSHISAEDNPHNVTKSQVGLSNIQNFVIAGIGDYGGVGRDDRYVTPSSVVEFVTAQVQGAYDHIIDENNPHNVTKAQVGLSNVTNLGLLTLADYDGDVDGYVSGLLLQQIISRLVSDTINVVSNNLQTLDDAFAQHVIAENPHNITPQLIGAASTSELASLSDVYLGKTDKAADSSLFNGLTTETFTQTVSTEVIASITPTLDGKNDKTLIVPQRDVVDQGEPADPENPPEPIYTSLEGFHNFASITLTRPSVENAEIAFIVSGHRGADQNAPTAEHIAITLGEVPTIKHHSMLTDTDVRFGYSIDGDVLNLWMTAKDDVVDYTLVSLSKMTLMDIKTTPDVTDVIPTGFVLASKTSKENPFGDEYDESYVRSVTRRFGYMDVQSQTIQHNMGTVDFDIVVKDLARNEIVPMVEVIDENNIMLSLTQAMSIVVIITFYLPMPLTTITPPEPPKVVDVSLVPVWTSFDDSVSFFNADNSVMTFESSGTLFKHWEADWPDEDPLPNLSTAPRYTWGSGADLAPRTMLMTISLVSRYTSANQLNYLDISVPFDTPISLDDDVAIEFIERGYVPNGSDIVLNITITDSLDNTIVTSGNYTLTKLGGIG